MKAIWLRRAATVADVRECLSSYRPLAYTTVLTVLDRLAKKGAVTRVKRGKTHFYEPLLCFEAARDSAVAGLLDFYFEGTVEMMIDYLNGKGSAPGRENHLTQDQNSSAKPSEEMQDCLL
jgi:BlaI family penicillinase repressor